MASDENQSLELVKRPKLHSKPPVHQPLPPIAQALPHAQAHMHLLDHQAHMHALHSGVDFNFHPQLHPHQFSSAYAAAAAAAAAQQSGLGHLPYDLPVHPLLMMASSPLGHQYFSHQQQQQQQQNMFYSNSAAALSLQQQMSTGDLSRIGAPPLRTV